MKSKRYLLLLSAVLCQFNAMADYTVTAEALQAPPLLFNEGGSTVTNYVVPGEWELQQGSDIDLMFTVWAGSSTNQWVSTNQIDFNTNYSSYVAQYPFVGASLVWGNLVGLLTAQTNLPALTLKYQGNEGGYPF